MQMQHQVESGKGEPYMETLFGAFLKSFGIKPDGSCRNKYYCSLLEAYRQCLKQKSLKPLNDYRHSTHTRHTYGDTVLLLLLNRT